MEIKILETLKLEHQELHRQLAEATKVGGKIAETAKLVAQTLHPHFVREEEFAIPSLGILPQLVEYRLNDEMKEVIKMTDKLKAKLPKIKLHAKTKEEVTFPTALLIGEYLKIRFNQKIIN